MAKRLELVAHWLKEKDIGFCMITSSPNLFYLSGFYTEPHERVVALFIFQEEEPFLVCPNMEVPEARNAGWSQEIIGFSDTDDPWELIAKALNKRNLSKDNIAIEKDHLLVSRYEKLVFMFPDSHFISAEEKINMLRMVKDEAEISVLRQAAELADYGVEIGLQALAEGKSELDVLGTIEFELKKKGIRQMSFDTMVLTGPKTASPHGKPGKNKIQRGDLVLFDLGVVLDGYCSDITRTVAFGNVSEEQRAVYETVLKAQKAAIDVCKPGIIVGSIDQTARNIISQSGYGEYFTHRIGHGLGIDVHEFPSMNASNSMLLERGMAFTIEPGIYVPNVGGVRIEDDLVVTDTGVEILTKYPKELQTVK